jgi:hypothetical protein
MLQFEIQASRKWAVCVVKEQERARESENGLIKPYGAKMQHVQRDGHRRMSKILKNG